jgi:hypothetical protein
MSGLRSVSSWFRGGKRRPKLATIRRGLSGPRHDRLWLEVLEARDLPSGAHPTLHRFHPPHGVAPLGTSGPTGYTPAQIRHAYGFDQITFAGGVAGDGARQTIAIVDAFDDPNIANDLHQFDLRFGLPDPPVFTKVNQNGGSTMPAADAGWASEIALDVEWAHAIAPRANILLVEANDNGLGNLFAAVDFARNQPGVVAVSMSWGAGEFSSEASFDFHFTTPAGHTGVTFVASSGDQGAPPSFPAISRNVLAVGGTTFQVDSSGNYLGESGWSGSGGGISQFISQPSYQVGVVTQSGTRRASPDVAYDANPSTGFPVFDSFNNGTVTPWSQFGGTSAGAPQWAALVAIASQGRSLAGLTPLDGPGQLLPKIYTLSAQDFHDITTGSSTGQPTISAGPGYDLVTGRGSPFANRVVADLVGAKPRVAGVVVNGGSAQRSLVTQVRVAFDQHVTLPANPADAFRFARQSDGAAVLLGATVDDAGSGTVVTLTFTGGAVDGPSLADGRYTLTALAGRVGGPGGALDGNGDGTGGDDFVLAGDPATNRLFRLFGDANGDGTINGLDLAAFRAAFGAAAPPGSPFDVNGDGAVNGLDLAAFRARFGTTV